MLGFSLHGWENAMVVALIIAGFFALLAGAATWAVVRLQRIELAESKIELEKYKQNSDERISLADARAAEANRIAEEERHARLKLEKEMAWRSLSDDQKAELVAVAKPFPLQRFELITYQDDPECLNLANQIAKSLIDAGWLLEKPKAFLMFPIVIGVNFVIAPSKEVLLAPPVNALTELFDKIGLPGGAGFEKAYDADNPEVIRIKIGKKPERIAR